MYSSSLRMARSLEVAGVRPVEVKEAAAAGELCGVVGGGFGGAVF
jgi:hypothetical protein